MKRIHEILKEVLGDDLPKLLSDSRNMDLVVKIYDFGFKQGAEVTRNAAKDMINEHISKMKEGRNEPTAQ